MSPEQLFLKQLCDLLAKHADLSSLDFSIVQILLWASILCSSATTLLTATGKGSRILVGVLAAIPALALTAESCFNFTERYKYHDSYVLTVETIRDGYKIRQDLTLAQASEKLDDFKKNGPQLPTPSFSFRDHKIGEGQTESAKSKDSKPN